MTKLILLISAIMLSITVDAQTTIKIPPPPHPSIHIVAKGRHVRHGRHHRAHHKLKIDVKS